MADDGDTPTPPEGDPLEATFTRSVEEGARRLDRSRPALLATGMVGGLDVGVGVLALLVVERETGSEVAGALAFGIGFIALMLANSELFTENFLVPFTAVIAREQTLGDVARLWGGTAVTNLAGGWVLAALTVLAFPDVRAQAVAVGDVYPRWGIGASSFAAAVLGGVVITLLTWMEHATESVPARLVAAVAVAFVLAASPLNHVIVASIEMFAALVAGAPFGYADWAGAAAWAALGNVVGGLVLVTVLRLVQLGRGPIEAERDRSG